MLVYTIPYQWYNFIEVPSSIFCVIFKFLFVVGACIVHGICDSTKYSDTKSKSAQN